jgi:hypothetical protein
MALLMLRSGVWLALAVLAQPVEPLKPIRAHNWERWQISYHRGGRRIIWQLDERGRLREIMNLNMSVSTANQPPEAEIDPVLPSPPAVLEGGDPMMPDDLGLLERMIFEPFSFLQDAWNWGNAWTEELFPMSLDFHHGNFDERPHTNWSL